uniref:ABC transporter permease n=1 Tax=Sphondylothamnion multifidum TaxID=193186 RepID=A0A4D6WY65_9FLOR|nr:hypothetical protein [Sphondylothamnion multifidum]
MFFSNKSLIQIIHKNKFIYIECINVLEQINIIGPDSLSIILLTSFFIGLVFSLQIVKEFLALDAVNVIGSILTISFVRELSPVLTSIILVGKIGSCFTSELATMKVTEQVDVLYLLDISPLSYLILPRFLALVLVIPLFNIFSFLTSIFSSIFFCFTLYDISPNEFIVSSFNQLYFMDICKSCIKTVIFGCGIASISCFFGMTTEGSSKEVGVSTTVSVVSSLVFILIIDFILSYFLFDNSRRLLLI